MSMIFVLLIATAGFGAHANPAQYDAFQKAFQKEGFTEDQCDAIQLRYYQDGMDNTKWPFTNFAKELFDSAKNLHNDNAHKVAAAIEKAGGNPQDLTSVTHEMAKIARAMLGDDEVASSLLQPSPDANVLYNIASNSEATFSSVQYLSTGISLTTGSVASNTAVIGGLSSAVATNTAAIAGLSTAVGTMSQVTGPTVALAGAMGVPVSTVASMALAGSFVGPMLGVIAMVWASYPDEEVDPWMKVESRVALMINAKFDLHRRKRLGDRLRRYVKQYSRCAQAWVADGLVKLHGLSIPRWLVEEAKLAKGSGDFSFNVKARKGHNYPAPSCTAEIEGHMALERDEWFRTDKGQMSGLFMPFANMHTQLLGLLADHPYDDDMQWGSALKATSAEYGVYMLDHLLSAWKAQVCRTMRLRHSQKSGIYWSYNIVVLKGVEQPHAAEDCSAQCGGTSGWCNYCGGKDEGACCTKGDDGVCKMFDVPEKFYGGKYAACVQTDCIQKNTGYYGGPPLKKFEEDVPRLPEECQQLCWAVTGAVAFTLNDGGKTCSCLAQKDLNRHQEEGAFSGPTVCKKMSDPASILEQEKAFEKNLNETVRVPMEELDNLCPKSPSVSDAADLEKTHPDWVRTCYKDATKAVTREYNKFYQRFAQFVDMLAWKAGCGMPHEVTWSVNAKSNGFEKVSKDFDGGSFADCDWDREETMDQTMWIFDAEKARGWLGLNRINMDEQKTMTIKYPMPAWLHDLKNTHNCLKNTAAGQVANPNDDKSTQINDIMEPAAMDDGMMRAI